ncbi:hypothetical protein EIP91_008102 [Steccherinum ochraceum]|uniref:Uncharacterized protein n=1 Tax=Steccherinum ochraceum TaxID=92696 RepID=A0A4R0R3B3_9APHY|nr:hypothetical protein EIP91_008102 [Steccherinum ochraceum]
MSRVTFQPTPAFKAGSEFGRRWGVSLGLWGAAAGVTAVFLLSTTPLVKRELLSKVPVVGDYWKDKTPASDKFF